MQPRFITIKSALLDDIAAGRLQPGAQVASENQLATRFGVSRMTARRAISELVTEGILARTQGVGTFVADSRPMASMLTVRGIQEEIRARGHKHHCELLCHDQRVAENGVAQWMGVDENTPLFYTELTHFDNDLAVQLEYRWVNPSWVPEYIHQDFSLTTPNEYLSKQAPLTEADHVVEAVLPSAAQAAALGVSASLPCLQIHRRTFSHLGVISVATLIHPGDRYRLGDHLNFTQSPNKETS
ncbi:histidine utilization repressor [Alteromonas sp. ASW11-19]|uniref:Histidine utilization repressor n=1 Tax=Alteromonas salexigens TaxID=2982530 RepID=A0ABT2VLQ8_9ALTE|nr:histidine utilization repressor [Alteromonas salexigens]MCU7554256.1 histidine utilization repressor [Alteromonas salexigens]